MAIIQVTIVLREKLEEIGVEVSVETFEESQGIAGLGDDPFVSCTMVHVVRLVVLATHFVRVDLVGGQPGNTFRSICLPTGATFKQKHF